MIERQSEVRYLFAEEAAIALLIGLVLVQTLVETALMDEVSTCREKEKGLAGVENAPHECVALGDVAKVGSTGIIFPLPFCR